MNFLHILGEVPINAAGSGGNPPLPKSATRADSQDLMDQAHDAPKRLPKR